MSYQIELIWDLDFVRRGAVYSNLDKAIEDAEDLEISGDGGRVKETRIVDDQGRIVWAYGQKTKDVMKREPYEFWWVKIKPYKDSCTGGMIDPGWEPMMRRGSSRWFRAGVIHGFDDDEILEVGPKIEFHENMRSPA